MNLANQNSSMNGNDGNNPGLPLGQNSSMIGNDPGLVPSSSRLPLGQSSRQLKSQFNSQEIEYSKTISENEIMALLEDEEINSKSAGNDNQLADDQNANNEECPNKRARRYRHNKHQIKEMEAFFKECPRPDERQREELGRKLGLEPLQVKFWFQNKRTLVKNKGEHNTNSLLRFENDKLKAEFARLREAVLNDCPNCGGSSLRSGETPYNKQLRLENARLQKEVDRISKPYIIEVAMKAMEELLEMAQIGEPLWLPYTDRETNFLNEEEYERRFHRGNGPMPREIKTEASREVVIIAMNHIKLVEILMDTNYWASLFSSIVSKAFTMHVVSAGVSGNLNGAMQKIYAEFQVPSPQVPTRDCYFVRYCKRIADKIWAVVDVSLDHTPTSSCRKRPSGCIIQDMSNGYSKVTWIEHMEIDDTSIRNIYKLFVDSGLAFGAKRWISILDRQCERLASALITNLPLNDICHMLLTDKEGRKNVLKLGERMVISYYSGVSATTSQQWTTLTGSGSDINDVRIMTRMSINDPGRPHGIVMSASTSLWLPIPPKTVFNFLRDENTRSKWDILCNGNNIQEVAHIANGRETGNCVSILRVNSLNSAQSNMLILQESNTDPTGSFIVYAPINVAAINKVLCGGHPDYVQLLPSGFVILPDGPSNCIDGGVGSSGGSLFTIAFQILVDNKLTTNLSDLQSIATVNNLMSLTINKIIVALLSDSP